MTTTPKLNDEIDKANSHPADAFATGFFSFA